MKMSGEEMIAAPREAVWRALNDTDVLKACIPGCQSITRHSPTRMEAKVVVKLGPVKASFSGVVDLSNMDPPKGYRISGKGQGGLAGFASGGADVKLEEVSDGTLLKYDVDAQVGGKMAMLGARLIDSTAQSLATQFFEKFAAAAVNMKLDEPMKKIAKKPAAKRIAKKVAPKKAAKKPIGKKPAAKKVAKKKL
jgi:uncharacterized protein